MGHIDPWSCNNVFPRCHGEYTVRNIKPEIHRLDLMYEDLDFKYQHNLHDTLLGLKVPTVGFGNPKLSCVKIRSESKSNTLFTLTI